MKLNEILNQKVNSIKTDIIDTIVNLVKSKGVDELTVRTHIKGSDFQDDIFVIYVDIKNITVYINSKTYDLNVLPIEHLIVLLSSIENK